MDQWITTGQFCFHFFSPLLRKGKKGDETKESKEPKVSEDAPKRSRKKDKDAKASSEAPPKKQKAKK